VTKVKTESTIQRTGTRIRIDDGTKRIVAQILDENREVIKQIPPEDLLQIAARLRQLEGLLFDSDA
jgi:flagellar protein FlaG